jgi:hypothetical protein
MNFNLDMITTNAIVIVPIIIALTQAVKLTGFVKDHFAPLIAIVFGILIAWFSDYNNASWGAMILTGAVYGLMSSGLYSGVRTTMSARSEQKAQEKREEVKKHNHNHNHKKR